MSNTRVVGRTFSPDDRSDREFTNGAFLAVGTQLMSELARKFPLTGGVGGVSSNKRLVIRLDVRGSQFENLVHPSGDIRKPLLVAALDFGCRPGAVTDFTTSQ